MPENDAYVDPDDATLDRLAFAVEDYIVRMYGVLSSHRPDRDDARAMLRQAADPAPDGVDWLTRNAR